MRTTQGLLLALKKLLKVNVAVPNYTTLSRRQKSLKITVPKFSNLSGPINVAVDSTGLKIFGEGEWKVKMHGKSKRRTWRKLHICIDVNTQNILCAVLTKANIHDAKIINEVLPEKTARVMADGIYDTFGVYNKLISNQFQPIIPPRKNAALKNKGDVATLARNAVVSFCHKFGLSAWKIMSGYHKRSLVETAMSRLKRIFSGKLKAKGIIFGSPTFMGSVAGEFKLFIDESSYRGFWTGQKLVDKMAAGFTVATYPSGDKLNTLIQISIFAAQSGMIWVNNVSLGSKVANDPENINQWGSWLGLSATSIPDRTKLIDAADLKTAEQFGERFAQCVNRWNGK